MPTLYFTATLDSVISSFIDDHVTVPAGHVMTQYRYIVSDDRGVARLTVQAQHEPSATLAIQSIDDIAEEAASLISRNPDDADAIAAAAIDALHEVRSRLQQLQILDEIVDLVIDGVERDVEGSI